MVTLHAWLSNSEWATASWLKYVFCWANAQLVAPILLTQIQLGSFLLKETIQSRKNKV